ncbi:hypothetical protein B5C34_05360 [Pacificimonas flava]|uniref:Mu-like prophage FluMu protein gp28 n=2 Tax=Pacificimonas TaxID=1960290 RepID=A0A219B3L0_9SPHN|nr:MULTISPECIES: terminase family protein [Pacificimonas]MBZ6377352.1 terminase family protein [Pacificimonas aurantium]OWV32940.1 hypothetical protein B5C34_05360 [Pacificimonas flava]
MSSEPALQSAAPLPPVLLPYQGEAIALSHREPLLAIEKSRRTGITWAFAMEAVLVAGARRGEGGQDVFYIAYNLDMTREFIGYCAEFTKSFDIVAASGEFLYDDGSERGIQAFRIEFPSGFAIVALSSKPRSLRGKQGLVIIDEAAFHDELDELLKAALALLMWGGRVIVISTHDGADNPFNLLLEEIRDGKREGAVYRIDIAQALADGLYKRICLRTGQDWSQQAERAWLDALVARYGEGAQEELYCIPARGSGSYLDRAAVSAVMGEGGAVVRYRGPDDFLLWNERRQADHITGWFAEDIAPHLAGLQPSRPSFLGQDFARSSDLTAVAIGQLGQTLVLDVPLIIELRNTPFREQFWILSSIIRALPLFTAGKLDARGNGQQLAEDLGRDFGADRVVSVMTSQQTYLDGFPRLKERIEARTIALPRDADVLDDHRMVKRVRGVPMIPDRSVSKADGAKGKRHGDTAIATMLLCLAAEEDLAPIDLHRGAERTSAQLDDFTLTQTGFGTVRRASPAGGF